MIAGLSTLLHHTPRQMCLCVSVCLPMGKKNGPRYNWEQRDVGKSFPKIIPSHPAKGNPPLTRWDLQLLKKSTRDNKMHLWCFFIIFFSSTPTSTPHRADNVLKDAYLLPSLLRFIAGVLFPNSTRRFLPFPFPFLPFCTIRYVFTSRQKDKNHNLSSSEVRSRRRSLAQEQSSHTMEWCFFFLLSY